MNDTKINSDICQFSQAIRMQSGLHAVIDLFLVTLIAVSLARDLLTIKMRQKHTLRRTHVSKGAYRALLEYEFHVIYVTHSNNNYHRNNSNNSNGFVSMIWLPTHVDERFMRGSKRRKTITTGTVIVIVIVASKTSRVCFVISDFAIYFLTSVVRDSRVNQVYYFKRAA